MTNQIAVIKNQTFFVLVMYLSTNDSYQSYQQGCLSMNIRNILILIFLFLQTGCISSSILKFDYSDKSLSPLIIHGSQNMKSSGLTVDYLDEIRIVSVDGNELDYGLNGHWFESQILLSSGTHTFTVIYTGIYDGVKKTGKYQVSANLKEDTKYRFMAKGSERTVKVWIEDSSTGKKVTNDYIFTLIDVIEVPIYVYY